MKPIEQWMIDNHIKKDEPFVLPVSSGKRAFIIKSYSSINALCLKIYNYDGLNAAEMLNSEREGYQLIANGIEVTPELKPCPICGKTDNVYTEHYEEQGQTYFSVCCRNCHVETTEWCNKHIAINIWNGWKRSQEQ